MSEKEFKIDYSIIHHYYNLHQQMLRLTKEVGELSRQIKNEMENQNITKTNIGSYELRLETKNEVSQDFIDLLKEKHLTHFIKESCTMKNFRQACKILELDVGGRRIYLKKKDTKWLYVDLVEN